MLRRLLTMFVQPRHDCFPFNDKILVTFFDNFSDKVFTCHPVRRTQIHLILKETVSSIKLRLKNVMNPDKSRKGSNYACSAADGHSVGRRRIEGEKSRPSLSPL